MSKSSQVANLPLSAEDLEQINDSLSEILLWMSEIDEIDVSGVEPLFRLDSDNNHRTEDAVHNPNTIEEILQNTPSKENNLILAPKTLESE